MDAPLTTSALRGKAEQQLSCGKPWVQADESDPARLIHELQVHQIELQMQTEALRDAFADADALRAKYQDLFEFAPVGYLTLSRRGTIFEANKCAARLLDQKPQALVGRKLRDFIREDSVAGLDHFLAAAGESPHDIFAREIALLPSRPFPRFVNMQAHSVDDTDGTKKIRLTLMDVSALKTAKDDVVQAIDRASGFADLQ